MGALVEQWEQARADRPELAEGALRCVAVGASTPIRGPDGRRTRRAWTRRSGGTGAERHSRERCRVVRSGGVLPGAAPNFLRTRSRPPHPTKRTVATTRGALAVLRSGSPAPDGRSRWPQARRNTPCAYPDRRGAAAGRFDRAPTRPSASRGLVAAGAVRLANTFPRRASSRGDYFNHATGKGNCVLGRCSRGRAVRGAERGGRDLTRVRRRRAVLMYADWSGDTTSTLTSTRRSSCAAVFRRNGTPRVALTCPRRVARSDARGAAAAEGGHSAEPAGDPTSTRPSPERSP
jgi:hypothetical protein